MELSEEAKAHLEKLTNLRLVDLVAEDRRDRYEIRHLADADLERLSRDSADMDLPKIAAERGDVWLITIIDRKASRHPIIAFDDDLRTSGVQWIDRPQGLIRTQNSLYKANSIKGDEPPPSVVRRVAQFLQKHGLSQHLGAPEIF